VAFRQPSRQRSRRLSVEENLGDLRALTIYRPRALPKAPLGADCIGEVRLFLVEASQISTTAYGTIGGDFLLRALASRGGQGMKESRHRRHPLRSIP
jgi:hypothetical protein